MPPKKKKNEPKRIDHRFGTSGGERITLDEFDAAIPAIRALVDANMSLVMLGMQVDLLERSDDFDEAVADKILADPERPPEIVASRRDVATAVAWARARCGDKIPDVPPPAFLIKAAEKDGAGSLVPQYITTALKTHHREIMGRFKPKDFQDPNEVNVRLREIILNADDRPAIITRVWEKWPFLFEWVASWDRYSPENMQIQRDALHGEITGKMTASETRTFLMKKYDARGHARLERALMREAMQEAATSSNGRPEINLE